MVRFAPDRFVADFPAESLQAFAVEFEVEFEV